MPRDKKVRIIIRRAYRVDIILPHGVYAEYTSKSGVDLPLANSLATHLKMHGAGGRIVQVPSGLVLDEWSRTYTPHEVNDYRDIVQAMRHQYFGESGVFEGHLET
jgi:hypothetical protein